jgi:hypothetical protein
MIGVTGKNESWDRIPLGPIFHKLSPRNFPGIFYLSLMEISADGTFSVGKIYKNLTPGASPTTSEFTTPAL